MTFSAFRVAPAIAVLASLGLSAPAQSDEISDALRTALESYEAGDIQFAIDDLDFARGKLMEKKSASLGAFLPEAPAGWTRQISTESNALMGMMGGGVGAEATYISPSGGYNKLSLMADNPMVASMGAMVTNAAAMGLKLERVGRQRIARQDDQLFALIANRVLITFDGPDHDGKMEILGGMDFDALAGFGQ